jgi:transcriptional regulator with XRE-family HTH domain
VKSLRASLGVSQEKLGNHLGVTFQQVQKYEKGINRISASTLYKIAGILGARFSYFTDGYDENHALRDNDLLSYDVDNLRKKESIELLKAYYKISNPTVRKKIAEAVKAMVAASCSIKGDQ